MQHCVFILLVYNNTIDDHKWLRTDVDRVEALHECNRTDTRCTASSCGKGISAKLFLHFLLYICSTTIMEVIGSMVCCHVWNFRIVPIEYGAIKTCFFLHLALCETYSDRVAVRC